MKTQLITALVVAGVLGTAATAMAVNSDTVASPDPSTIVLTDAPTPDPLVTPDAMDTPDPEPMIASDPSVLPLVDDMDDDGVSEELESDDVSESDYADEVADEDASDSGIDPGADD